MSWLESLRYNLWGILRYYRSRRLSQQVRQCGPELAVEGKLFFSQPETVILGSNVHLGDNLWAQTMGGLTIGNNVIISHHCTIHTLNHDLIMPDALPYGTRFHHRPVIISDNVWIGMKVIITPGSVIGEGAVIGMGAVVSGEIPPLAIAVGNPAKVIKYRDRASYERLKREEKWLRYIRGITTARGWHKHQELRRWSPYIKQTLSRQYYVTTQEMETQGADYAAALLYFYARPNPELNFAQHNAGYMVYHVQSVKEQLQRTGSTTLPLEVEEIAFLQQTA